MRNNAHYENITKINSGRKGERKVTKRSWQESEGKSDVTKRKCARGLSVERDSSGSTRCSLPHALDKNREPHFKITARQVYARERPTKPLQQKRESDWGGCLCVRRKTMLPHLSASSTVCTPLPLPLPALLLFCRIFVPAMTRPPLRVPNYTTPPEGAAVALAALYTHVYVCIMRPDHLGTHETEA